MRYKDIRDRAELRRKLCGVLGNTLVEMLDNEPYVVLSRPLRETENDGLGFSTNVAQEDIPRLLRDIADKFEMHAKRNTPRVIVPGRGTPEA